MAIKTYEKRVFAYYEHADEETGEIERLPFCASARIFPLFLEYTGEELLKAMDDYGREITRLLGEDTQKIIGKLNDAGEDKEKLAAIYMENPDAVTGLVKTGYAVGVVHEKDEGLTFLEALAIVMHANALNDEDRKEALAAGYVSLPQEVYADADFLLGLFSNAMGVRGEAQKKTGYRPSRRR